jgi:hypothetical protein
LDEAGQLKKAQDPAKAAAVIQKAIDSVGPGNARRIPEAIPLLRLKLAELQIASANLEQAKANTLEALRFLETEAGKKNIAGLAGCYLQLGNVNRLSANYNEAEQWLLKYDKLAIQQGGESHAVRLLALRELALLYIETGTYAEAEAAIEAYCRIEPSHMKSKPHSPSFRDAYIGKLNLHRLRLDEAHAELSRAYSVIENRSNSWIWSDADCASDFAFLLFRSGNSKKSLPIINKVIDFHKQSKAPDQTEFARDLDRFAKIQAATGNVEGAKTAIDLAVAKQNQLGNRLSFALANALKTQSEILSRLGASELSRKSLEESEYIASKCQQLWSERNKAK